MSNLVDSKGKTIEFKPKLKVAEPTQVQASTIDVAEFHKKTISDCQNYFQKLEHASPMIIKVMKRAYADAIDNMCKALDECKIKGSK
jgi:hypothetical protein